jgi:hypothetical protein
VSAVASADAAAVDPGAAFRFLHQTTPFGAGVLEPNLTEHTEFSIFIV